MTKYRKGKLITNLNELMEQDFIIWDNGCAQKVFHKGWVCSWQIKYANRLIKSWQLYKAITDENKPLTLKEIVCLKREPIYLVSIDEEFQDAWQLCIGVDKERLHCLGFFHFLWLRNYGKTWIAYRKPVNKH